MGEPKCSGPYLPSVRPVQMLRPHYAPAYIQMCATDVPFNTLQYDSIRVICSHKKFIHFGVAKLWCRRWTLRSGLKDCTDSKFGTGFSLCRLLKSCVSSKFSILIAFLSSLLLFAELPPSIKNELATKTDQFRTAQRQVHKLC